MPSTQSGGGTKPDRSGRLTFPAHEAGFPVGMFDSAHDPILSPAEVAELTKESHSPQALPGNALLPNLPELDVPAEDGMIEESTIKLMEEVLYDAQHPGAETSTGIHPPQADDHISYSHIAQHSKNAQDPLSKLEKKVFGYTDSTHPQDPATSPFSGQSFDDPAHPPSDVPSSHAVSSTGQPKAPRHFQHKETESTSAHFNQQTKASPEVASSSSSSPSPYVSLASVAADSGLSLRP